jgi:hypothetical protein
MLGLRGKKIDWKSVDWRNVARNAGSHTLLAFAALVLAQIVLHVEGWFQPPTNIPYFGHGLIYKMTGHGMIPLIPISQATSLLWHIVPVFCVIVLGAAFVEPKKAVEKTSADGRLYQVIRRDDPYFLVWPSRVLGVLLAIGAGHLWGNQVLALLEIWIAG